MYHFTTGAEMYRHRLWRFQLTLAVVCTGERRLYFFFCNQKRCSHKYVELNKIVFCTCEKMHLISVLFSVFRDVHNLTFVLLQTKKIITS
jgi:uncharacterized pyridoxamine 5'-phosphate oxidase family protein